MPKPLQGVDWELIKALWLQGLTWKALSSRTGVKPATIRGKARYQNWRALRDTAQGALSAPFAQAISSNLALQHSNASKTLAKASQIAQEAFADEIQAQTQILRSNKPRKLLDLANTPKREGRASVVNKLVNTAAKLYGWDAQSAQPATLNLTQVNVRTNTPDKVIDVPYE